MTDPDQAYFWTDEWQAAERQVDEEIAVGQYKDFDTMDEFLDDLLSDSEEVKITWYPIPKRSIVMTTRNRVILAAALIIPLLTLAAFAISINSFRGQQRAQADALATQLSDFSSQR